MKSKNKDDRSEIATLKFSGSLAKTVLNSLSANIAILDENGVILETNKAWENFATKNQMRGRNDSIGVNYLELCDATIGKEAKDAHKVAAGIRSVIKGETKEFLYDYPCHVMAFGKPAMKVVRCLVERPFTISFATTRRPAPLKSWGPFSGRFKNS